MAVVWHPLSEALDCVPIHSDAITQRDRWIRYVVYGKEAIEGCFDLLTISGHVQLRQDSVAENKVDIEKVG